MKQDRQHLLLHDNNLVRSFVVLALPLFGVNLLTSLNDLIDTYFIRYILNWISVYSRYVNFTNGIFDIAATVYYLSITAVFLFLSVRIYERRRYA